MLGMYWILIPWLIGTPILSLILIALGKINTNDSYSIWYCFNKEGWKYHAENLLHATQFTLLLPLIVLFGGFDAMCDPSVYD